MTRGGVLVRQERKRVKAEEKGEKKGKGDGSWASGCGHNLRGGERGVERTRSDLRPEKGLVKKKKPVGYSP